MTLSIGSGVANIRAGRTGARLWGTDATLRSTGSLLTDGRHIFTATEAGGTSSAAELVAYDPVTGDEAFRVQYPEGISPMGEVDRRLMGYDDATDEYVLLG